jgi:hypothetical protein
MPIRQSAPLFSIIRETQGRDSGADESEAIVLGEWNIVKQRGRACMAIAKSIKGRFGEAPKGPGRSTTTRDRSSRGAQPFVLPTLQPPCEVTLYGWTNYAAGGMLILHGSMHVLL